MCVVILLFISHSSATYAIYRLNFLQAVNAVRVQLSSRVRMNEKGIEHASFPFVFRNKKGRSFRIDPVNQNNSALFSNREALFTNHLTLRNSYEVTTRRKTFCVDIQTIFSLLQCPIKHAQYFFAECVVDFNRCF